MKHIVIGLLDEHYDKIVDSATHNAMYLDLYLLMQRAITDGTPLDKIRAEIEQLTSRYSISKERGSMGQIEWSDRLIKESDVLQVTDKYKAESEERDEYRRD